MTVLFSLPEVVAESEIGNLLVVLVIEVLQMLVVSIEFESMHVHDANLEHAIFIVFSFLICGNVIPNSLLLALNTMITCPNREAGMRFRLRCSSLA